jgi:PPK2 family polyphosphate:nucleotide phosphotransferase
MYFALIRIPETLHCQEESMDPFRVKPGQEFKLKDIDPDDTGDYQKDKVREETRGLIKKLDDLQELLYAEHHHKVLVVLQGMDTSGKDGTIRKTFEGVNPQGVRVASFKVPTPEEADHDYLWRIHRQTPGSGELVIFNRSHYENVLVVRVHNLVPKDVWKKRYQQINHFEQLLADEGTTILKFFLHISKDEQRKRLLERVVEPAKNWKFNPDDLKERELWDAYQEAYEDMLNKTSTRVAPWIVVPANHKWFRDFLVAKELVSALGNLKMKYPPAPENLEPYRVSLSA